MTSTKVHSLLSPFTSVPGCWSCHGWVRPANFFHRGEKSTSITVFQHKCTYTQPAQNHRETAEERLLTVGAAHGVPSTFPQNDLERDPTWSCWLAARKRTSEELVSNLRLSSQGSAPKHRRVHEPHTGRCRARARKAERVGFGSEGAPTGAARRKEVEGGGGEGTGHHGFSCGLFSSPSKRLPFRQ